MPEPSPPPRDPPPHAVLITQCLQADFVGPIGKFARVPNLLHIGHDEAERLLGPEPEHGPLAQLRGWANAVSQSGGGLTVIHVRDWHNPDGPGQREHIERFGAHCLEHTDGAKLVLGMDADVEAGRAVHVNALTLNDAVDSDLGDVLASLRRRHGAALRVAVIGVWTDAKVTFLLYELATRWGVEALATCSALTASSSRDRHFAALDQLARILGVKVCHAVGELAEWLGVPGAPRLELAPGVDKGYTRITWPAARALDPEREGAWRTLAEPLLRSLYQRESRISLHALAGGFSGAGVFRVTGYDDQHHEVAPTVVKVGARPGIAAEKRNFEAIEAVLGNDAPSVRGFVEAGDMAAIKYAYAGMGTGGVHTFKALWERWRDGASGQAAGEAIPFDPIAVIDRVHRGILQRLIAARRYEPHDLLRDYGFVRQSKHGDTWHAAASVAEQVDRALQASGHGWTLAQAADTGGRTITIPAMAGRPAQTLPCPSQFYGPDGIGASIAARTANERHAVAYVHGDLNYANILLDGAGNVWVIDFAHAGRKHATRDLHKAEADALYLLTRIDNSDDLAAAMTMADALLDVQDLAVPPVIDAAGLAGRRALTCCWELLVKLRTRLAEVCDSERNPAHVQLPMLCYATQSVSYSEANGWQRLLALYVAARLVERIRQRLEADRSLRLAEIPPELLRDGGGASGPVYLTLCPGRRDRGRVLAEDVETMRGRGVNAVVCLASEAELAGVGVELEAYRSLLAGADIAFYHEPIADQSAPPRDSDAEVDARLGRLDERLIRQGKSVVVHCIGGLGRTGLLGAALLVRRGMTAAAAIAAIRRLRSPRAVETPAQQRWVEAYAERVAAAAAR